LTEESANNFKTQKNIAKNSFYSFLVKYETFFFSIMVSFLIARILTKELWGFFIIAVSYITILLIFNYFVPPGLEFSINYYVPRYIAKNQKAKLKSFIKNVIYLKMLFLIPYFLINVLLFYYLSDLFSINLKNYTFLLLILAPLIIIDSFDVIFKGIIKSFNMFRLLFYITLLRGILYSFTLLYCFLFISSIGVDSIALINVISHLVPFCILFIIIILKIRSIEPTNEKQFNFKETSQKSLKYGIHGSINFILFEIWYEIPIQAIGIFDKPENVTGYKIGQRFAYLTETTSTAFKPPLTLSFSSLHAEHKRDQIVSIYNIVFKYSLFLMLTATGILFFFSEFFLYFIYGESYLIFSLLLKLILIATIFKTLGPLFESLIYATNKVKYLPIIRVIFLLVMTPLFFIGLIYFGLIGAIYGLMIGFFIIFLLEIFFSYKIGGAKLNLKIIIFQYLAFFIALGITILLEELFLRELRFFIFQSLNLNFLIYFAFLAIITFFLIHILLNLILKIFNDKDIEYLESYFDKDNKLHKTIRKWLKFLKREKIFKKK